VRNWKTYASIPVHSIDSAISLGQTGGTKANVRWAGDSAVEGRDGVAPSSRDTGTRINRKMQTPAPRGGQAIAPKYSNAGPDGPLKAISNAGSYEAEVEIGALCA